MYIPLQMIQCAHPKPLQMIHITIELLPGAVSYLFWLYMLPGDVSCLFWWVSQARLLLQQMVTLYTLNPAIQNSFWARCTPGWQPYRPVLFGASGGPHQWWGWHLCTTIEHWSEWDHRWAADPPWWWVGSGGGGMSILAVRFAALSGLLWSVLYRRWVKSAHDE